MPRDAQLGDERVQHGAVALLAAAALGREDGDVEEGVGREGRRVLHLDDRRGDDAPALEEHDAPRLRKRALHRQHALVDLDLAQHALGLLAADGGVAEPKREAGAARHGLIVALVGVEL